MKLDYKNSGIKTLRFASPLMLLAGILSAATFIPGWFEEINRGGDIFPNFTMIGNSIACFSAGLFFSAMGLVLATIAENSLYQKQKDEIEKIEK